MGKTWWVVYTVEGVGQCDAGPYTFEECRRQRDAIVQGEGVSNAWIQPRAEDELDDPRAWVT